MFWWHAIVVLLIVIATSELSVAIRRKAEDKEKVTKYDYFLAIIGDIVGGLVVGGYIGFQLGTTIRHLFITIILYFIVVIWLDFMIQDRDIPDHEERKGSKKFCLVYMSCHYAFILLWIFLAFSFYSNNYQIRNESVVSNYEDRKLIYFCNLPVEKASESMYDKTVMENGNVSVNLSTMDELHYWYENTTKGALLYGSTPADNSEIWFIKDNEEPYLSITNYSVRKIITDKEGREKDITQENVEWTLYVFYLPKSIKQYILNG